MKAYNHENTAVNTGQLSVVIPALNEAAVIARTLEPLQALRRAGHQIILVDGGSTDATCEIAASMTDIILDSPPGRARQMTTGAEVATGDLLWFLHADSQIPPAALSALMQLHQTRSPQFQTPMKSDGESRPESQTPTESAPDSPAGFQMTEFQTPMKSDQREFQTPTKSDGESGPEFQTPTESAPDFPAGFQVTELHELQAPKYSPKHSASESLAVPQHESQPKLRPKLQPASVDQAQSPKPLPGDVGSEYWGHFQVRLDDEARVYRLIAWSMNLRTRLTSVVTGDQGLFVSRALWQRTGGFRILPLMEDVEISKRLRQHSRAIHLKPTLTTSARRWKSGGTVRTIVLMWWLRLAYVLGVSPERLAAWYRPQAGR